MNNNNQKDTQNNLVGYTQCFWHSNGNLVCQNLQVPYNKDKYKQYVEFDNFSTPNQNYKPNEYRKYIDYYEAPNNYTCNVPCNNCKKPQDDKFGWMSPPLTYDKKMFYLNQQNLPQKPNYYYPNK